jgi:hypothetical protein
VTETPNYEPTGEAGVAANTEAEAPAKPPAEPAAGTSGDRILAEARAKLEAGEGLDGVHVRAIEHPEEFEGV